MLVVRALRGLALGACGALVCVTARADNVDDDDLRKPKRLTVDVADDLLGQLSPDGATLYFVSNRNTTNQLFVQDRATGLAHQLFDDGADVTWPRVSPDGHRLLYISFRDSASGQLCLRDLPSGEGRRCMKGAAAALQAEWIDRDRIALVSRQSIQADLRVLEVTASTLQARPIVDRNMTSPAVSPDGRWLVYVPVARTEQTVGPAFAAHASQTLEAVPIPPASTGSSGAGAAPPAPSPVPITLELPGQTGQPAFARDGHSLYVVQFFSDTNHDGTVDASDHGILFRVPLSFDTGVPVAGPPEQLTETSWNCEYPTPFSDRLLATCSLDASLDLYELPLDGEVPASWTKPQLVNAIDDADTLVEQQLLTSRLLARETTPRDRRRAMMALVLVHLEREEFRAAEYFAGELHKLRDASTAGISVPLRLLVEQRRAERRREQGRLMEGFRAEAKQRLDQLHAETAGSPMAEDLTHLVRSEIFDSTGDKADARRELELVTVDETTPPPFVEAYYRHVDGLYRELDDREALTKACRELSANPSLTPDQRLRYAQAAVRAMVRGVPYADADARLVRERATVKADEAELAFAIDLARDVLAIRDAHTPHAVGDALLALYGAQTRPGRRRALIVDAVQRADDADADDILDALVQRDVHEVKPGTHERGEVEDIYERVILARAYERMQAKKYADARDDFDSVAAQTGSLEAVVGGVDMRVRLGDTPAAIEAHYARPGMPAEQTHFAKGYLLARELPKLEGAAHAKAAADAIAAVQAAWAQLKDERIGQALMGALLHEEYLETGDLGTAERANVHYLIALELVGDNPRFGAMVLGELGLLHTDVGNYRIALSYLLDREKLPSADNSEGLDVLLSKAQALLHAGREADAAAAGDAALEMIARNPSLAKYKLLALDWAALDNLAAGRFSRALALYDQEIPLIDGSSAPSSVRNRVVLRMARAAAAVGADQPARALVDLDAVDASLRSPRTQPALAWPNTSPDRVMRSYHLMSAGLRAKASRELGHLDAEAQAIEARHAILAARFKETGRVEIERQDMLAEAQLAWNAGERHDVAATAIWVGRAVAQAMDLRARDHGVSDADELDVLRLAAALTVSAGRPLVPDLAQEIAVVSTELASRREPSLRRDQRWLEIYGAMLAPAGPPVTATAQRTPPAPAPVP